MYKRQPKDAPNAQMMAMMKAMGQEAPAPKVVLEINPRHEVIRNLNSLQQSQPELAVTVLEQLTDNALLAAGLLEDPQAMITRLNALLAKVGQ